MNGVDRGNQHRTVGTLFTNFAHFQKWYKKAFLGKSKFSLLQVFTAWNMPFDEFRHIGRGVVLRPNNMVEW